MDYVRLSTNLYIHHVHLSRNLYVHYVRLSTAFKAKSSYCSYQIFASSFSFLQILRKNMKKPAWLQLPGQPAQLGDKVFAPAEKVGQSEKENIFNIQNETTAGWWKFRSDTSAIGASLACKEACTASSDAFAALKNVISDGCIARHGEKERWDGIWRSPGEVRHRAPHGAIAKVYF